MRKIIFLTTLLLASHANAVWVNGYIKNNGTYVPPYVRSAPDGNPYNNFGPHPDNQFTR